MSVIQRSSTSMQRIVTFLWFNGNAEQAVNHYLSIFDNAKIIGTLFTGSVGPGTAGSILSLTFQLEGQEFVALNGGPNFKFTEAISLLVKCESQTEVDTLWGKLSAGGEEGNCGWLKDKFGLSWQVVPTPLYDMLQDPDPEKSARVMRALMQMRKLDLGALKRVHAGP